MGKDYIREALIRAGVNNLGAYGYPAVRPENILTDLIYSAFFRSMLVDNLGQRSDLDEVINDLISEIDAGRQALTGEPG